jgi:TetR/AcrR family transcriptional regulator, repressor of fatR-cypB operon
MARLIDENKIIRIKEATIELVVQHGYGGASISTIAKKAGVAEGYLYRFHSSKQELVNDLLHSRIDIVVEKIESLVQTYDKIIPVIRGIIDFIFTMGKENPANIRFLSVLMHDYSFKVSESQLERIKNLIEQGIAIGLKNDELKTDITLEEFFGIVILWPIEFINLRMKGIFGSMEWTDQDAQNVAQFSVNALKK